MNRPHLKRRLESSVHQILSTVRNFHLEGKYWDVQLQIDDELFKCQRSLLAAMSEYFDLLFSSNFKESKIASDQPIILHDINAEVFKVILNFMYTGEIDVDDSNVFDLLVMNDFLRLRVAHIREQCINYLETQSLHSNKPPMSNALDLFNFASLKADSKLVDVLSAHICQHLHHYSKDVKLIEISFESLNKLVKFSQDYILPLCGSQNVVLSMIFTWVFYNREERRKYHSELMRNIDFSNISYEFIRSLMTGRKISAGMTRLCRNRNSSEMLRSTLIDKIKTGPITDDTRFSSTITFVISLNEISGVHREVLSSSCIISNLSWCIGIRRPRYGNKVFGFFLHCSGPSSKNIMWDCFVTANLNIVSHKKDGSDFVTKLGDNPLPEPGEHRWSFDNVIDWDELINPGKGYVKDDSVTILAEVFADVPYRGNN